ncbi:complex proteins associated with Set1p component shg1-domain-containing protein [Gongronella butleri]|nr:complex proteins associated with Set1p component shg1-domain-containing protein [Gongronella butleri]
MPPPQMQPDQVVTQLKKKGVFDDLRKQLLAEFQSQDIGTALTEEIKEFIQDSIAKDPSLLDKDRNVFHATMMDSITKNGKFMALEKALADIIKQDGMLEAAVQEKIEAELHDQP